MIKHLPFIIAAALLTACSGGGEEKHQQAAKPLPPTVHEESLQKFTGARTKIVWTQYQNPDKVDKQGTSRHHYLMALDSADGRGERRVFKEKANCAYPIITPDGEHIVFTRKQKIEEGSKRRFDVTISIVKFDGSGLRELGKGYAQEVWEDPQTGRYWVYAGDEFVLHGGTAPICKRIVRFPIDDPGKRETIWDKTRMGTDSFAISADGKRFAGLFPWPDAGLGNLETNDWEKLTNGCWVSIAPDNSYDSWVFDGAHKNLLMFDSDGTQTATIPINTHPELKGNETYHPRWGNHRQFFVLSGPHRSGKKKKNDGKKVEIYLGKFSPQLNSVEQWFKVTDNGMPDIYPDVWVDPQGRKPTIAKADPKSTSTIKPDQWPSKPDGLLFKWENVKAKNEFTAPDGSNQVSKTEPSGLARYGRNFEMVLAGGSFEPVLESDALARAAAVEEVLSFQGLVTASAGAGHIFSVGPYSLRLDSGKLSYAIDSRLYTAEAEVPLGEPTHLALSEEGGDIRAYLDGTAIDLTATVDTFTAAADDPLTLGGDFDGSLENIAFYKRPLTAEEVATDYALIKTKLDARKPVERLQVKGKLLAKSPLPDVESIKPYVRALVYYLYEVDGKQLAVGHWAILDSKPLGGLDREIGQTYELTIEPKDAHPQLVSQAENMDEEQIDFLTPLYYDITTPTPKK